VLAVVYKVARARGWGPFSDSCRGWHFETAAPPGSPAARRRPCVLARIAHRSHKKGVKLTKVAPATHLFYWREATCATTFAQTTYTRAVSSMAARSRSGWAEAPLSGGIDHLAGTETTVHRVGRKSEVSSEPRWLHRRAANGGAATASGDAWWRRQRREATATPASSGGTSSAARHPGACPAPAASRGGKRRQAAEAAAACHGTFGARETPSRRQRSAQVRVFFSKMTSAPCCLSCGVSAATR
jgi:hypothetical protein